MVLEKSDLATVQFYGIILVMGIWRSRNGLATLFNFKTTGRGENMLRIIERFCDRVDGICDRVDHWAIQGSTRYLLVYLVGTSLVAVVVIIVAAIFTCLYLGRLPYGLGG